MAALSIRQLVEKLNNYAMRDPDVNKEAIIRDAWVASRNNKQYPEGTVVFEVVDNNATPQNLADTTHELTIFPDSLGIIN